MSIENLTRYEPNFDEANTFSMEPTEDTVDVYIKFDEAVEASRLLEASSNSIKQLKEEIAALVQQYESADRKVDFAIWFRTQVERLRQLSTL